ncbi:MAG: mycofactocin system FadH/OYE family oxidoreductase 1 [Acidimicrobiales bacterium]
MRLLEAWTIAGRTAPNRVMFGPHVTNLGQERTLSARHVAYYKRRAIGGCGVIVIEEASVDGSDWPYERAPLATDCRHGWEAVATAVHNEGALAVGAIGHSGGQGSSAFSQRELWAPSRVPEVASREVPKWMEPDDIAVVVEAFGRAARHATEAGLDGVEVNAGQHSLVRQFLSGLTNHRGDEWGTDRLRFARDVLSAVRSGLGGDRVLGLRLCCDELAPWAGITPEAAVPIAVELAPLVDYLVVTRGSIYTVEKYRPDYHEPQGFNIDVCRSVRGAVADAVPVVLQGSIVEWEQAEAAVRDGVCDAVEMTRAQVADPDLVGKVRANEGERVRPCIRCNQMCQVRDARNPIVACVGEPSSGHETDDPDWYAPATTPRDVLVVGGGVAGLECARVASHRGHRVRVVEREAAVGGVAARFGPGAPLVAWLEAECRREGVAIEPSGHASPAPSEVVVAATGSRPGTPTYSIAPEASVVDVVGPVAASGVVALWDPIGGPIAVALAESLGARAVLITPDQIAGNELSRTGDLAPANVRLQQKGVRVERRAILREARPGEVEIEDRFSGARRVIAVDQLVDCGFRLPDESVPTADIRIGDCVAPRTIHEAILEGRRAALAIDGVR